MLDTTPYTFNTLASKAREVKFNPLWSSDTNHFQNAIEGKHSPVLKHGEVINSIDPRGRRIVMIGFSDKKNLVFFERYSAPQHKFLIEANLSKQHVMFFMNNHDLDLHCMVREETLKEVYEIVISKKNTSIVKIKKQFDSSILLFEAFARYNLSILSY